MTGEGSRSGVRAGTGRSGVLVLLAAALLAAGCSSTVTGSARAADDAGPRTASAAPTTGATTTGTPSTPSAPASSAPASSAAGATPSYLSGFGPAPQSRPADLPLDGVDLCGLVPATVQQQVGITGAGVPSEQECAFPLAGGNEVDVRVVDGAAAGFLGNAKVAGFPVAVGGYLAVVGWNLPDDGGSCFVNLDANGASNLEIGVNGAAGTGTDTLCPLALSVAAPALEQLRAG